jgi:predicted dienelactone hydrolase
VVYQLCHGAVMLQKMLVLVLICQCLATVAQAAYDPLQVNTTDKIEQVTYTITDKARQRDIPIRVYLPQEKNPAAVVLFSHGLGGSKDNNPYLGNHWAKRGYVVVFMQHPGSDEAVWKNAAPLQRMTEMRKAASTENFALRVKDVPAVIDQLTAWNKEQGHQLHKRMNLEKIGMSGHSFGANTTQAVSGQSFPLRLNYTDPRIKAAVLMSPSAPALGNANDAFGKVSIPWLCMTGTKDVAAIGGATVESRLAVYPALPAQDKYEIVLHDAEHSAFSERGLPGDKEGRNPNHHRVILGLTTAFWDAYLMENTEAKQWLTGTGAKQILQEKDRWQLK